MEVRFTPEQEVELSRIAAYARTDTEEKNRFGAAVREGIAQADRGELIDDDEVRVWLERQERS